MDLAILIVISSIAYRGACAIVNNNINGTGGLYNPMWTTTSFGKNFVSVYMFASIPISCLNGLLLYGWIGLLIAGITTWIGMPLINLFFRYNPGSQFQICGIITLIWTFVNLLTKTI